MKYFLCWFISASCWAASHHPMDFLANVAGTPREGEVIVEHFCATCHAEKPVIALGAPRMGASNEWANRLTAGCDVLLKHVMDGYGAMPARGGCFECSDEQLKMAVSAMLLHTKGLEKSCFKPLK